MSRRERITVVILLLASAGVNAVTVHSVRGADTPEPGSAVTPIPANEIPAVRQSVTGTFATGDAIGDRTIKIDSDGTVHFRQLGSTNAERNNDDHYELGRRGGKRCLATTASGIIDIFDSDTLIYFGDSYRRK